MADEKLKARGVSRDAGDERTLNIAFDRVPTDDEMRVIHDVFRTGLETLALNILGVGLDYGSRGFAARPTPGVKH